MQSQEALPLPSLGKEVMPPYINKVRRNLSYLEGFVRNCPYQKIKIGLYSADLDLHQHLMHTPNGAEPICPEADNLPNHRVIKMGDLIAFADATIQAKCFVSSRKGESL